MAPVLDVDRQQWLGYRWARHGLAGNASAEVLDDLLLLGFQDSRHSGARMSLAQRMGTEDVPSIGSKGPLVCFWSIRGAPHVHPIDRMDLVRDALAPVASDESGAGYLDDVEHVADALRTVITEPITKPDASAAANDRVDRKMLTWCQRCESRHIPDGLFRAGARAARILVGPPDERVTVLYPPPRQSVSKAHDARETLLRTYLRVNGPTARAQYRDWSGADATAAGRLWKKLGNDIAKVRIDNRRFDVDEDTIESLRDGPASSGIALVPPHDPYLRQTDRTLLVPDKTRRARVWRAVSAPGAVLIDGEVAGTWRYRAKAAVVTVSPFDKLTSSNRQAVEDSAQQLAAVHGGEQVSVSWE